MVSNYFFPSLMPQTHNFRKYSGGTVTVAVSNEIIKTFVSNSQRLFSKPIRLHLQYFFSCYFSIQYASYGPRTSHLGLSLGCLLCFVFTTVMHPFFALLITNLQTTTSLLHKYPLFLFSLARSLTEVAVAVPRGRRSIISFALMAAGRAEGFL